MRERAFLRGYLISRHAPELAARVRNAKSASRVFRNCHGTRSHRRHQVHATREREVKRAVSSCLQAYLSKAVLRASRARKSALSVSSSMRCECGTARHAASTLHATAIRS